MTDLNDFVRRALGAGHGRDEIRQILSQAGWPDDEVVDALARFASVDFPIPVPCRRTSGSPREAFLYIVTFIALYTWTVSLGQLLWGFVDLAFSDPLQRGYDGGAASSESLNWGISAIIVSFPVYYFPTRAHLRSYLQSPERRTSTVRRWLTYLTLAASSITVLWTLVVLVANALGPELTVRSILKSLIVISIAGGSFGFYFWEVRQGDEGAAR